MKTIITTSTVLKFAELTDEQKAKAIELNRDCNVANGVEWWDAVESDFREIAKLMGVEVDRIHFSGFWCQGDGACFTGRMEHRRGCVAAVKGYAPQDAELHRLTKELQELHRRAFYTANVRVMHSGRYYHERSMDVEIDHEKGAADDDTWLNWCADFASWLYARLEAKHDYLTGDDTVAESLEANEAEFAVDDDGGVSML